MCTSHERNEGVEGGGRVKLPTGEGNRKGKKGVEREAGRAQRRRKAR